MIDGMGVEFRKEGIKDALQFSGSGAKVDSGTFVETETQEESSLKKVMRFILDMSWKSLWAIPKHRC